MLRHFAGAGALSLAFLSFGAVADVNCQTGFRPVTQKLKVSEFANDLARISIFEDGQEIVLATGGQGHLTQVINSWLNETNSGFEEQTHTLDYDSLMFTQADTAVELLDADLDGRLSIRFCMPANTASTTTHAVFGDDVISGIQSTVGQVRGNTINAVANRATGAWFRKYNEGRENSGSERLLRMMQDYYGSTAPRSLTELQVIALNEMYSAALVGEQITGGNDLNVDIEGNTIYVENTPTRMCFTDATTSFKVGGVELLNSHCVSGLENRLGLRFIVTTDGMVKTGTIEDAQLGATFMHTECNAAVGSITVGFSNSPSNIETVFEQNGQQLMVTGPTPVFSGTCDPVKVTNRVLGNQELPLYEKSITVLGPAAQSFYTYD